MSTDHTQPQSDEDQRRAQQLSRQRTRPPLDVPGYEVRQFLGSGAYGEVWVAIDENTGRHVAIKYYAHRGGLDWSLLSREVEKLVFLSADRYVVQLLDVGWDSDPPYYVMEYIEKGSLEEKLTADGPLPAGAAVELFREVAIGLMHAHSKGVLHCDLKPANILLDQDGHPRLADFGQSRLSHEQSPALGTLFYMAPEQADLEAVPDARWDVYALGALLYCMLTGAPPHRTPEVTEKIDSAHDLTRRLAQYRTAISSAAPPAGHRQTAGVDTALADIVDRCLHVDPTERFPTVQTVLDALQTRRSARERRPLVALGFVGPVLLLLVMALFSWRAGHRAISDSERSVIEKTKNSNAFAARFVSEKVANDIDRYFRAVERVAADPQFVERATAAVDDPQLHALLVQLKEPGVDEAKRNELRKQLDAHPARQPLQQQINAVMFDPTTDRAASWFFTDADGTSVAIQFERKPQQSTVGRNYAYRTYFHGGAEDLDPSVRPPQVAPIDHTHLSAAFISTASFTWKVAISTPVFDDSRLLGVLALTAEVGNFVDIDVGKDQQPVLVDTRAGERKGVVLQHPLYDHGSDAQPQNTLLGELSKYRVDLDQWNSDAAIAEYQDPFGASPQGAEYRGEWIAAKAPVQLRRGIADDGRPKLLDTGLVVLVQQQQANATGSVQRLGQQLIREALLALLMVLAVIIAVWYFVLRYLVEPARSTGLEKDKPTPLHSMETVAMPRRGSSGHG